MIWSLLLNRYVAGGAVVLAVLAAVFFAGDRYGFNASNYAACKSETERRNAAVSAVNADETRRHAEEEAKRAADRAAFDKASKGIGQCLLTGDQAAALNGIGE
jgi:hypothetical protein